MIGERTHFNFPYQINVLSCASPTQVMLNTRRQYIFSLLAKLPLLLLYMSFFMVQLFFNFDISKPSSSLTGLVQTSIHCAKQTIVKKAPGTAEKKNCFRLNKRYHPQPAIGCNPVIIQQNICVVSSKLHVHYSSGFIPSATPSAQSMRGPPLV